MVQEKRTSPALKLEDIGAPADTVVIDGKTYDLASTVDLGLRDRSRIQRIWERVAAIEKLPVEELSDDLEREYDDRLAELCRVAIPTLEPEVLAKLAIGQRQAVATTFFVRALQRSGMASLMAATAASASPSNGPTSSPSSSAPTAATPAGGS